MSGVNHSYRYVRRSSLTGQSDKSSLFLAVDQAATNVSPAYLTAVLKEPEVTAKSLRAVSEIVGLRFYTPPSMLARVMREADPVVTVGRDTLRFEGFSACCSTYIRLDIDDNALEVEHRGKGTTNVDFGPELRALLTRTSPDSRMEITIGSDAVGLSHELGTVTERKVPLPVRWIKGLAEVQGHLSCMEKAFSLSTVQAQRFLRGLPRSKSDHRIWVKGNSTGVRTTTRPVPDGVPLRGGHRLRVLESLVSKARALHVYFSKVFQSSAWVLDFGTQRVCLVLNAEPWRGFPGDGRLLSDLAHIEVESTALRAQLNWQDELDLQSLARGGSLSLDQVKTAMSHLAASGLVGFDLSRSAWFHRVLPFDMDRVAAMNPRLSAARQLVEDKAVKILPNGADVTSEAVTHRVRLEGDSPSCTCPWYSRNKSARGPCKHILAVEIALEQSG